MSDSQTLEFGFIPQEVVQDLKDIGNWKSRATAIDILAKLLKDVNKKTVLVAALPEFVTFMMTLVADPNFKIAISSMAICTELVSKVGPDMLPFIGKMVSGLVDKFTDSKVLVKAAIMKVFKKLMSAVGPTPVVSLLARPLHNHTSVRVREEVCNTMIAGLLTFSKDQHDIAMELQMFADALSDQRERIRQVALEGIAVIGNRVGVPQLHKMMGALALSAEKLARIEQRLANPTLPNINTEGLVEHMVDMAGETLGDDATDDTANSQDQPMRVDIHNPMPSLDLLSTRAPLAAVNPNALAWAAALPARQSSQPEPPSAMPTRASPAQQAAPPEWLTPPPPIPTATLPASSGPQPQPTPAWSQSPAQPPPVSMFNAPVRSALNWMSSANAPQAAPHRNLWQHGGAVLDWSQPSTQPVKGQKDGKSKSEDASSTSSSNSSKDTASKSGQPLFQTRASRANLSNNSGLSASQSVQSQLSAASSAVPVPPWNGRMTPMDMARQALRASQPARLSSPGIGLPLLDNELSPAPGWKAPGGGAGAPLVPTQKVSAWTGQPAVVLDWRGSTEPAARDRLYGGKAAGPSGAGGQPPPSPRPASSSRLPLGGSAAAAAPPVLPLQRAVTEPPNSLLPPPTPTLQPTRRFRNSAAAAIGANTISTSAALASLDTPSNRSLSVPMRAPSISDPSDSQPLTLFSLPSKLSVPAQQPERTFGLPVVEAQVQRASSATAGVTKWPPTMTLPDALRWPATPILAEGPVRPAGVEGIPPAYLHAPLPRSTPLVVGGEALQAPAQGPPRLGADAATPQPPNPPSPPAAFRKPTTTQAPAPPHQSVRAGMSPPRSETGLGGASDQDTAPEPSVASGRSSVDVASSVQRKRRNVPIRAAGYSTDATNKRSFSVLSAAYSSSDSGLTAASYASKKAGGSEAAGGSVAGSQSGEVTAVISVASPSQSLSHSSAGRLVLPAVASDAGPPVEAPLAAAPHKGPAAAASPASPYAPMSGGIQVPGNPGPPPVQQRTSLAPATDDALSALTTRLAASIQNAQSAISSWWKGREPGAKGPGPSQSSSKEDRSSLDQDGVHEVAATGRAAPGTDGYRSRPLSGASSAQAPAASVASGGWSATNDDPEVLGLKDYAAAERLDSSSESDAGGRSPRRAEALAKLRSARQTPRVTTPQARSRPRSAAPQSPTSPRSEGPGWPADELGGDYDEEQQPAPSFSAGVGEAAPPQSPPRPRSVSPRPAGAGLTPRSQGTAGPLSGTSDDDSSPDAKALALSYRHSLGSGRLRPARLSAQKSGLGDVSTPASAGAQSSPYISAAAPVAAVLAVGLPARALRMSAGRLSAKLATRGASGLSSRPLAREASAHSYTHNVTDDEDEDDPESGIEEDESEGDADVDTAANDGRHASSTSNAHSAKLGIVTLAGVIQHAVAGQGRAGDEAGGRAGAAAEEASNAVVSDSVLMRADSYSRRTGATARLPWEEPRAQAHSPGAARPRSQPPQHAYSATMDGRDPLTSPKANHSEHSTLRSIDQDNGWATHTGRTEPEQHATPSSPSKENVAIWLNQEEDGMENGYGHAAIVQRKLGPAVAPKVAPLLPPPEESPPPPAEDWGLASHNGHLENGHPHDNLSPSKEARIAKLKRLQEKRLTSPFSHPTAQSNTALTHTSGSGATPTSGGGSFTGSYEESAGGTVRYGRRRTNDEYENGHGSPPSGTSYAQSRDGDHPDTSRAAALEKLNWTNNQSHRLLHHQVEERAQEGASPRTPSQALHTQPPMLKKGPSSWDDMPVGGGNSNGGSPLPPLDEFPSESSASAVETPPPHRPSPRKTAIVKRLPSRAATEPGEDDAGNGHSSGVHRHLPMSALSLAKAESSGSASPPPHARAGSSLPLRRNLLRTGDSSPGALSTGSVDTPTSGHSFTSKAGTRAIDRSNGKVEEIAQEDLPAVDNADALFRRTVEKLRSSNSANHKELDWLGQYEALNDARRLVYHAPEWVKGHLSELVVVSIPAIDQLRSFTAKNAIILFQELFQSMGRSMDKLLDDVCAALIKKAGEVSNAGRENFLAQEADRTLTQMIQTCNESKTLAALCATSGSKSNSIRMKVAMHMDEVLEQPGAPAALRNSSTLFDRVFKTAVGFLEDGAQDTRSYGKRLVWAISEMLADREEFLRLAAMLPAGQRIRAMEVVDGNSSLSKPSGLGGSKQVSRSVPATPFGHNRSGSSPSVGDDSSSSGTPEASSSRPSAASAGRARRASGPANGPGGIRTAASAPAATDHPELMRRQGSMASIAASAVTTLSQHGRRRTREMVEIPAETTEAVGKATSLLNSKDWEQRIDGLSMLCVMADRVGDVPAALLNPLLDVLTLRVADGNAKVSLQAIQTYGKLMPGLRDRVHYTLNALIPALVGGLGASNEKVRTEAAATLDGLMESVDATLLVQNMSHCLLNSANPRAKPLLADRLAVVAARAYTVKPSLVGKYAVPAATGMLAESKGDVRTAAMMLIAMLYKTMGQQLMDIVALGPMPMQAKVKEALHSARLL